MALNPTYSVGTVSVSAGGTIVTGTGTLWVAGEVRAGDVFEHAGLTSTILSVESNTSLALARGWPGPAASGAAYEIRYTPDASRVLASARQVVDLVDGGNLPALSNLPSTANTLPYFTGPGVAAVTPITTVGREILAQTTPQAVRAALGLTGYAGAGIRIQGLVSNVAALPATGNTIGDAYLVGTNLYVWGGSAPWVNAGAVSGPAGADGVQIYQSRADAAARLPNVSASISRVLVQNGTSLEVRSRTASSDDPLFTTAPQWGVEQRQDASTLASEVRPVRLDVTSSSAAAARNADTWTIAPHYRNVANAVISFGPPGIPSPANAMVETLFAPSGTRMVWRDRTGPVFERFWNGTSWTAFVEIPSSSARSQDTAARTAISDNLATLAAQLRSSEDAGADVGNALIEYEDGRVALAQKADGLDFVPSQSLRNRLGGGGGGGGATAPDGGWAAQVVDGVTRFTGPAGCGLIDRYSLIGSEWRPTARMARVICHYGQSNAGVTLMGETLHFPKAPVPRHTLVLNDGSSGLGGIRGWMGAVPTAQATGLTESVERGNVQSIASAISSRLAIIDESGTPAANVVRSEARGGMPFVGVSPGDGIWRDSAGNHPQCYLNLIQSITQMVQFAEAAGYTVPRIYIPFTHQEADRNETRAAYLANWQGFKADVEAALASLGKQIIWLLDQASGTAQGGFGGMWPNRMSVYDATLSANGGANVYMVQPRYHLPMGRTTGGGWDNIHHSYKARVLQGEVVAHAIAEIEAGRNWRCAWPTAAAISGNTVLIDFDSIEPLTLDPSFCKVRAGMGFAVTGRAVTGVAVLDARRVVLTCDGAPAAGATVTYAYRNTDAQDVEDEWAVSAGALREAWQMPSRFVSGGRLLRPALAFSLVI